MAAGRGDPAALLDGGVAPLRPPPHRHGGPPTSGARQRGLAAHGPRPGSGEPRRHGSPTLPLGALGGGRAGRPVLRQQAERAGLARPVRGDPGTGPARSVGAALPARLAPGRSGHLDGRGPEPGAGQPQHHRLCVLLRFLPGGRACSAGPRPALDTVALPGGGGAGRWDRSPGNALCLRPDSRSAAAASLDRGRSGRPGERRGRGTRPLDPPWGPLSHGLDAG